jgi:hypothetical protein
MGNGRDALIGADCRPRRPAGQREGPEPAEITERMQHSEGGKFERRKTRGIPRRPLNEHETRLDLPCVLIVSSPS